MSVIDFDNGVVAETVQAGRRNFRRVVAFAVGLGMWFTVHALSPGPGRAAIAVGATVALWTALSQPQRRDDRADPELLALVHARIAEQDEKVVARLDRLIADLREQN